MGDGGGSFGFDLSTALGCEMAWEPLLYARSRTVHAAALARIEVIDSRYEAFKFTLSSPSGGSVPVASGKSELICTITNDDAALASSFVWLGSSLSAPLGISGEPAGATYLNASETSYVTRGGLKMRSRGAGFANNATPGVFGLSYWGLNNVFNGLEFELDAGNWEIGIIGPTDSGSYGTFSVTDDPNGAANLRYSYAIPSGSLRVVDTDGTGFTGTGAATNAINNLTFVSVPVSNLGGTGKGLVRITGTAPYTLLSAVALRKV